MILWGEVMAKSFKREKRIVYAILAFFGLYLVGKIQENIKYVFVLCVYLLFAATYLYTSKSLYKHRAFKKLLSPSIVMLVTFYVFSYIIGFLLEIPTEKLITFITVAFCSIALVFSVILVIKKIKIDRVVKSGIEKIDKMTGENFEIFLENLFRRKGYKVKRTPLSGDFGADLVIEKDNAIIAVQAKRYNDKVSLGAVQEVVGAIAHYSCNGGMVITNSNFTKAAFELANSNNIELWDREKLISEILAK